VTSEPLFYLVLLVGACELIRIFLSIKNNCAHTIERHRNSQTPGRPGVWDLCNLALIIYSILLSCSLFG